MTTSFTHFNEDILLRRALQGIEQGFYIDVGAYHPVDDSITKLFYDSGWSGINIEPNPSVFKLLEIERPRDINLDLAASDREGEVTFFIIKDTGLSTLQAEQAKISAGTNRLIEEKMVQTLPLAMIWDRYVGLTQDVHFLKIDVEGSEKEVIDGGDWKRHRPWILVIEATLPNSTTASHSTWEPTILRSEYSFAYFDGINRYYVANERRDLLAAFNRPANPIIDGFKPFMVELIERPMRTESIEQDNLITQAIERDNVSLGHGQLYRASPVSRAMHELTPRLEGVNQSMAQLRMKLDAALANDELLKNSKIIGLEVESLRSITLQKTVDEVRSRLEYLEENWRRQISHLQELDKGLAQVVDSIRSIATNLESLQPNQALKAIAAKLDQHELRHQEIIESIRANTSSKAFNNESLNLDRIQTSLSLLSLILKLSLEECDREQREMFAQILTRATSDDVEMLYLLLLGRRPESANAVEEHLKLKTVGGVLSGLVRSEEFRSKVDAVEAEQGVVQSLLTRVSGTFSGIRNLISKSRNKSKDSGTEGSTTPPEMSDRERYFFNRLTAHSGDH